jgi:hypothetical protein
MKIDAQFIKDFKYRLMLEHEIKKERERRNRAQAKKDAIRFLNDIEKGEVK